MTSKNRQAHADITLSDEAIDWLVKLNSGRAIEEDHADFSAWRLRSPEHELAAREAETIWYGVGIAGEQARNEDRKQKGARLARRTVLGIGGLMVIGTVAHRSGLVGPRLFADHVTGVGEHRVVTLPDGSSVFLNASSALSVNFVDARRSLVLHEGQATFTVRHDPVRPFIVEARRGRTRAVGTIFDIDIRPDEVAVTVVEGKVAITNDAVPEKMVIASIDERVRYASGTLSDAEAVDSDIVTAWRRGKLIFDRKPLGDVVAEIERYRGGRIVIANDGLQSLAVTGVFDLSDPDAILRTIEETLPVRVTRLPFVTIIR